jgi:anti-sigma B factor antagonist
MTAEVRAAGVPQPREGGDRGVATVTGDGLDITASVRDGVVVIVLAGEVDFATTRQSRTAPLLDLYRSLDPMDVVVDLSAVTFLDSGGLSWLVRVRAAALARGRRVTLRSPSEHSRRVLLLSGVDRLFPE